MPDPVLIELVCEQDCDAYLPNAGQDGQGVDIPLGPVCVEMQQVGVEGEWTREPLVSSILGRDGTCLLLLSKLHSRHPVQAIMGGQTLAQVFAAHLHNDKSPQVHAGHLPF